MKLLQYERSNQTWSAENILGSLSVQNTSSSHSKDCQGRIPIEIDRLHKGGPKGGGKKGDKGGKGKDGGKGKGHGFGGRGRGYGTGRYGNGRGFGKEEALVKVKEKAEEKESTMRDKLKTRVMVKEKVESKVVIQSKGQGGKGQIRQVWGEEQWQDGNEDQPNEPASSSTGNANRSTANAAPSARGNERIQRVIIEEVADDDDGDDDDDEVVDLIGMFDEMVSRLRVVRERPMMFDISEGDPEAIGRDDLQQWYENLEVDHIALKLDENIARMIKARPGESLARWSEEHQDWMVRPFELPSH